MRLRLTCTGKRGYYPKARFYLINVLYHLDTIKRLLNDWTNHFYQEIKKNTVYVWMKTKQTSGNQ